MVYLEILLVPQTLPPALLEQARGYVMPTPINTVRVIMALATRLQAERGE